MEQLNESSAVVEPEQHDSQPSVDNPSYSPDESSSVDTSGNENTESSNNLEDTAAELPEGIKKRLGRQDKKHQREIAEARAEIEDMRSQMQNQQSNYQMPVAPVDPNLTQDPYTGEWLDKNSARAQALSVAQDAQTAQQLMEQSQQLDSRNAEKKARQQEFKAQMSKAEDRYDDYREVVIESDTPFTDTMAEFAELAPENMGADLLYFLGKNPAEVKKIASLKPAQQVQAMIKQLIDSQNRKSISNAPPPVQPVGGSNQKSHLSLANMSYAQIKERDRQKNSRRR